MDIADEMTLNLLPLSLGISLDPVEFIQKTNENPKRNKAISGFIHDVTESIVRLEDNGIDVSRLLTYVSVKLESVKRITKADVLVGIDPASSDENTKIVTKRFDPNDPNWGRERDILARFAEPVHGINITQQPFRAVVWKYDIRNKPQLCWVSKERVLTKYSLDIIPFIQRLSEQDILQAITDYKAANAEARKKKHA